jgi:large-conductance mechanosensitive channel
VTEVIFREHIGRPSLGGVAETCAGAMFEECRKPARRSGTVDGTIGIIAGGVFGVIVSSMAGDLITFVVVFVVIRVLKKAARTLRLRRAHTAN